MHRKPASRLVRYAGAALVLAACCAQAQDQRRPDIYKCMLEGKVTYSNAPCDSAALRKDGRIDNKPVIAIGRNNGSQHPVVDWGAGGPARSVAAVGGSSALNWDDAGAIAVAVSTQRDEGRKQTEYRGPVMPREEHDQLFMRSVVADSGAAMLMQIYVRSAYSGAARNYSEARDAAGAKLELSPINAESDCSGSYGCTQTEDVGVTVTREYLERARKTGVDFQISGKAGRQRYLVPPAYVQGFLRALPEAGGAMGESWTPGPGDLNRTGEAT